jgi:hypothetical protein
MVTGMLAICPSRDQWLPVLPQPALTVSEAHHTLSKIKQFNFIQMIE